MLPDETLETTSLLGYVLLFLPLPIFSVKTVAPAARFLSAELQ